MPKGPTTEQLARIASAFNFHFSTEQLERWRAMSAAAMDGYNRLDQLPEPPAPVRYPRTPGRRAGKPAL